MLLRGQWVEVDRARFEKTMERFRNAEALAARDGLSFAEAMRMLAGASVTGGRSGGGRCRLVACDRRPVAGADAAGAASGGRGGGRSGPGVERDVAAVPAYRHALDAPVVQPGPGGLSGGRHGAGQDDPGAVAVAGGARQAGQPNLLVAPASLLGNWAAEIEKFAPGLKAVIVHPSAMSPDQIKQFTPERAAEYDLVITSYGSLLRMPVLAETSWRFVILDEAQAIKNPAARQTKAAKALRAKARIALTGTPVENHLGDLWSIFDFINPGLLGNAKQFSRYAKGLADRTHNPYGPLRELVRPYILRRMKTDKSVIADLPDKTEIKALCGLSRRQTALYGQAVEDLEKSLEDADGIQRKGVVLAMLMRLKQICNHPSQWLND